ncbi:MAG: hypothetical protein AAF926_07555, partial [Pseudomonadota bacterium]
MAEKSSIIKKTDSAVKTTESWASFGNLLRAVWAMIGAAVTTAAVQIWQSALNVGWEYWVVSAVVIMPLTFLGLSWA